MTNASPRHGTMDEMAEQLADLRKAFDEFRRDVKEREDLIEEQHRTSHRHQCHGARALA